MVIYTFLCQFQHLCIYCLDNWAPDGGQLGPKAQPSEAHLPRTVGGQSNARIFKAPVLQIRISKRGRWQKTSHLQRAQMLWFKLVLNITKHCRSLPHTPCTKSPVTKVMLEDDYLYTIPSPNRTTLKLCPAILPCCYVHFNLVSSWPAFLRIVRLNWNPAHSVGSFLFLLWMVFTAGGSVTPGNSCRMTRRPIFVVRSPNIGMS